MTHSEEYTIIPIVCGPQGIAGFTSSTVSPSNHSTSMLNSTTQCAPESKGRPWNTTRQEQTSVRGVPFCRLKRQPKLLQNLTKTIGNDKGTYCRTTHANSAYATLHPETANSERPHKCRIKQGSDTKHDEKTMRDTAPPNPEP